MWEVENGRLLQTLGEADDLLSDYIWGVTALTFSPDGSYIAATRPDNFDTVLWNIAPTATIKLTTMGRGIISLLEK